MSMIRSFKADCGFMLMLSGACRDALNATKRSLDELHNTPEAERNKRGYYEKAAIKEKNLNFMLHKYEQLHDLMSALERMSIGCDVEVNFIERKEKETGYELN